MCVREGAVGQGVCRRDVRWWDWRIVCGSWGMGSVARGVWVFWVGGGEGECVFIWLVGWLVGWFGSGSGGEGDRWGLCVSYDGLSESEARLAKAREKDHLIVRVLSLHVAKRWRCRLHQKQPVSFSHLRQRTRRPNKPLFSGKLFDPQCRALG